MQILILVGLLLFSFRYENYAALTESYEPEYLMAFLKWFFILCYVYIASVYVLSAKHLKSKLAELFISSIVSIGSLLFLASNKISYLISDSVMLTMSIALLILMVRFRETLFGFIFRLKPFDESEISKAFVEYPPKGYSDFLFFYILAIIIYILPPLVESIWKNIIL